MKCKNRHIGSTTWDSTPHTRQVFVITRDVCMLFVADEVRFLYPPGATSSACCKETRTVIQVDGKVTTPFAAARFAMLMSKLEGRIKRLVRSNLR